MIEYSSRGGMASLLSACCRVPSKEGVPRSLRERRGPMSLVHERSLTTGETSGIIPSELTKPP